MGVMTEMAGFSDEASGPTLSPKLQKTYHFNIHGNHGSEHLRCAC